MKCGYIFHLYGNISTKYFKEVCRKKKIIINIRWAFSFLFSWQKSSSIWDWFIGICSSSDSWSSLILFKRKIFWQIPLNTFLLFSKEYLSSEKEVRNVVILKRVKLLSKFKPNNRPIFRTASPKWSHMKEVNRYY